MPKKKKLSKKLKCSKNAKKKSTGKGPFYSINKSKCVGSETVIPSNSNTISETPVKKRRASQKNIAGDRMNITNLNILFDSELIYNDQPGNNVYVDNIKTRKRSHSSVPKFSSPNQGEIFKQHKYTQTPEKTEPTLIHDIKQETPKKIKIYTYKEDKPNIKTKFVNKKYSTEININPYLQRVESKLKEDSYSETSFFCPNLFQPYSSTPKPNKEFIENIADALFSPKTPKCPRLDKSPKPKVGLKPVKTHAINLSTRKKTIKYSPKSVERTLTKIDSRVYYSKFDITNKSVDVLINNSDTGCCENLFSKLKKYCKITQEWTGKFMNVCFHLGTQIKNTFGLYAVQNTTLQSGFQTCNRCKEYQDEIKKLSIRINKMEDFNKEKLNQLNNEIQKMKDEFGQFINVKDEVEHLKSELNLLRSQSICKVAPAPPPMPPPPPPPPPPLPPMMPLDNNKLKNTNKIKKNDKENSRPVICLEDILKVKLKKTNYQPTPTSRRSNQPCISLDMLRQVKLKPSNSSCSSSSKILSTPESDSINTALSPNTNLCVSLEIPEKENSTTIETDIKPNI